MCTAEDSQTPNKSRRTPKRKSNGIDPPPPKAPTRDEVLKKLNGTTLMVYFVLLNKHSIVVRELQRHLALSSPSVARYHLDKLLELALVENQNGTYVLMRKADIPVLTSWVLIGRYLVPRILFAATFFSLFLLSYLIFIFRFWNRDSFVVILMGVLISGFLWAECYLAMKNKPI